MMNDLKFHKLCEKFHIPSLVGPSTQADQRCLPPPPTPPIHPLLPSVALPTVTTIHQQKHHQQRGLFDFRSIFQSSEFTENQFSRSQTECFDIVLVVMIPALLIDCRTLHFWFHQCHLPAEPHYKWTSNGWYMGLEQRCLLSAGAFNLISMKLSNRTHQIHSWGKG